MEFFIFRLGWSAKALDLMRGSGHHSVERAVPFRSLGIYTDVKQIFRRPENHQKVNFLWSVVPPVVRGMGLCVHSL